MSRERRPDARLRAGDTTTTAEDSGKKRRTVLKGAAGALGVAAVSGAGVLLGSNRARASAATDYGDATVTSDDGTVEYVAIYGDSVVEWDGFETEATQFSIDIDARVVDVTSWVNLHETGKVALDSDWGDNEALSGPGTSGTIESSIGLDGDGNHDPGIDWHVVGSDPDGYGLPGESIDPVNLEVDADGASEDFTVEIRSVYKWFDASGSFIFEKTFTSGVDVDVTNEETSASGSGTVSGATAE